MITTLKQYETKSTDSQSEIHQNTDGLFFERKMMILESNWDTEDIFNRISVYPFLSNISQILGNKRDIKVGHRHFDSVRGLRFYTRFPEGKIWNDELSWGTQVYYIAAHGGTASIQPSMDIIRKDGLMDALKGFDAYPNIIFLGGCGVFSGSEGNAFGFDLLGSSGTRAIFGFESPMVNFLESTVIDLMFLSRFYGISKGNPFDRLGEIYRSVLEDFKPAKDLGFTMFLQ